VSGHEPDVSELRAELDRLRTITSLILLDLFMPTMDGWTFRFEQLSDPTLATIPVVVISADPNVVPTGASLGAVASMRKPLDLGLLLETVARHC
jgi:two-component system chemotaxis response regulator CheY